MREFPVLNLLHTKYGQQGLKVVAINLFSEDRFENVKSVVKQFEVQFQVLLVQGGCCKHQISDEKNNTGQCPDRC